MMDQLIKDIEMTYGRENAKKVHDVVVVVSSKVKSKNLFGWRYFLEDALIETISWIIKTEFQYSGGAYVACGMQSAIDHCRWCNAKKRRENYESMSLDAETDEGQIMQVADPGSGVDGKVDMICWDIAYSFGQELSDQLRPFLSGEEKTLSREVKQKIQSEEFKKWFEDYYKA